MHTHGRLTPLCSQLSIDALHTATPNLADLEDIAQCTYTHGRLTPPPPPIKHRSLENHYTKYISYIAKCIYIYGRLTPTPSQSSIDALHTASLILADIAQWTYTHGRLIAPLSQLSIDAFTTATPNLAYLADIAQCTYTHGRLTSQSIKHRCLEYHYTKPGRSRRFSTMHIYT